MSSAYKNTTQNVSIHALPGVYTKSKSYRLVEKVKCMFLLIGLYY